jgi:hypothetical protein
MISREVARGWGKALKFGNNRQIEDVLYEFQRLTSDEARAAFVDKWTRVATKNMEDSWGILYEALRVIRDCEVYKNAYVMEDKKARDSFKQYWEEVVRKPFAMFVELESTYKTVQQIEPELIYKLKYGEARTKVQEQAENAKDRPGQGTRTDLKPPDNIRKSTWGTSARSLTERIKEQRPDILERMKANEFRSVRAAAIEAGFVRPTAVIYTDSPKDAARAIKRHFKGKDLEILKQELDA